MSGNNTDDSKIRQRDNLLNQNDNIASKSLCSSLNLDSPPALSVEALVTNQAESFFKAT